MAEWQDEAVRKGEARGAAELAGDTLARVQEIVRSEVQLAAAEMKGKAAEAAKASALVAGGATAALYGGAFVLLFAHKALSRLVGPAFSALLIGAGLGAASMKLVRAGVDRLKHLELKPERTIRSVKEDIRTATGS